MASDKTKTDKTLNATKCQSSWLSDCEPYVMRYSQKITSEWEFRNLVSIWLLHLRFTAANSFRTVHLLFRQMHRMAKKQSEWHLESGSESWQGSSNAVAIESESWHHKGGSRTFDTTMLSSKDVNGWLWVKSNNFILVIWIHSTLNTKKSMKSGPWHSWLCSPFPPFLLLTTLTRYALIGGSVIVTVLLTSRVLDSIAMPVSKIHQFHTTKTLLRIQFVSPWVWYPIHPIDVTSPLPFL